MNLELFNVATQGVAAIGTYLVKEDQNQLNKSAVELIGLTDEELRARCLIATRGEEVQDVVKNEGLLPTISSYFSWFKRRSNSLTIRRIALAIEAFRRAPADLPPGSGLYSQQVQAAVSLTRHCLIQMDTGEGKTYALLPAAFALACDYNRVYIVCANEYLAWRDAHRTSNFWEFVGLEHSLCLSKTGDGWSSRVIYTTLSHMIFKHMVDLSEAKEPAVPILFGAVLLDEADAVLLDQGDQAFSLIDELAARAFDWSFALEYAQSLTESEEIETDYRTLQANLTVAGETRLREKLGPDALQESTYLLTRLAVELAYVALQIVIEDRDYVIEAGRVYSIDPVTGKVLRNVTPHWVIPLEFQKGLPTRTEQITLDQITTLTFLQRFQHLSGLSGTIIDDALEYLLLYFLPTLLIKPRKKRHQGVLPDLIYRTKPEAHDALCEEVVEAVNAGRPILVGTQTIADAEAIYRKLSEYSSPTPMRISLLTGKNDYEAAQTFAAAGEVGSVVIATQLAGRGVDIRLSEAARRNGGLFLFGLGHSRTIRHDKQFLGRAGRQGDAFTARFICSLQDELLRVFAGEKVDWLMHRLGMEQGVAIESSMVTRRIAAAQNAYRRSVFWDNQKQALLAGTALEIRKSLERWFEQLQLPVTGNSFAGNCSQDFLEFAVDFYLENVLAGVFNPGKSISAPRAEQAVSFLNTSLGLEQFPQPFSTWDLEGRDPESANSIVRKLLLKKLNDAAEAYQELVTKSSNAFWNSPPDKTENADADADADADNVRFIASVDSYRLWRAATSRTPRQIAFWTIRSGWMTFMEERKRIIHRIFQKRLSYLEHYRSITDQIANEWQKSEREFVIKLLRNLLRSAQPLALDELFVYEDNRVASTKHDEQDKSYAWETGHSKEMAASDPTENIRRLITQFVAQADSILNETFTAAHLRRLLADFTEQSPLYMLQSPSQIQKAWEVWNVAENERGVSEARRKIHKVSLRKFLIFLRERKLIAALPGFQTRLRSEFAKFIKTVTETRTALTLLGVSSFLTVFILVVYLGNFAQPKQLGPFGAALDQILFAGLLAHGNSAAPAFGSVILASIIGRFLSFQRPDSSLSAPMGYLVLLCGILFSWWLTNWHFGQMNVLSVLQSLGVFCSILAVVLLTKRITSLIQNSVGLDLMLGWIGICLVCVFLPAIVSGLPDRRVAVVLFFSAVSGLCYFWQEFNQQEIELISTRLKSSSTSMEVEPISGTLRVKADCGAAPHVYGVISAWLLYEFFLLEVISQKVSMSARAPLVVFMYGGVAAFHILYVINRRLAVEVWQTDLNERHQMIKEVRNRAELGQKLKQISRRLLFWEFAFQALVLGVALFLFRGLSLSGTAFPLSVVICFTVFLFADSSKKFAIQLYRFLYIRTPMDIEVLDLSNLHDQKAKRTAAYTGMRVAKITFAVAVTVYGFFEVVSNIYDILKKLQLVG